MTMNVALCILLMSFQTAGADAQGKPGFSGEWILVTPSDPPAGTARKLTVALEAASVGITRVSDTGSDTVSYRLVAPVASAAVKGTSGSDGASTKNEARWAGSSLRFDDNNCRSQRNGIETCVERSEVWSAGPKPGLLTIETTTYGPGKRVSTATFVYRRPER